MGLSQQLVQKQTQKLIMTQDLRQSIELLPLSNLELSDKIQSELIDNPLLEEVSNPEKPKHPEILPVSEVKNIEKHESLKNTDVSWQDILALESGYSRSYSDASDKKQKFIESSPIKSSLTDHLNWQFRLMTLTERELEIGEMLISMLDERGYFTASLEELSKETNIHLKTLKKILKHVQLLDPPGIGAKDMQESLLIQAQILYPTEKLLQKLLKKHFVDLEKMEYKKIVRSLDITEEELSRLSGIIKKLEPYPASLYAVKKVDYIVPDVIIRQTENEFTIHINDEWLPKLSVNQEYKEVISKTKNSEDKEYITTKMNSAQWLIRSINQRRQTLYKVINSIVESQIDFFREGIQHIKPLTLKDIAEKLNMHESTISRITTNKYVQTSWGIYELKWFFSSGVRSSEGGKESSKKLHEIIKNLIKEENPESPLSDQDIVDKVSDMGIEIARRTVAKYRKVLKILPSNRRKK